MTMTRGNQSRRGTATVEMTLVGIPLIFVLISTMEMARGMWIYHTLAYGLKEGTRFAIVHGQNCDAAVIPGNSCLKTVANVATVIQNASIGLDPGQLQVRMQSLTDDTGMVTLTTLLSNTSRFPSGAGASMQSPLTFTAQYPFQSAIAMFWPGAGKGMNFTTVTFPASTQEKIQF